MLITLVDSLKRGNKKLVAKINSLETELNHVSENYISQPGNVTQVNQDMKALFSGINKDKELLGKELNKLETKFAEREDKMSSLERKLQKYKESKQLIRNLNRNFI